MSNPTLMLGTAKKDITPDSSLPLSGFASRNGQCFERIDKRIHARFFYFRQADDGQSPSAQSLLVTADLLNWSNRLVRELSEAIEARLGIPRESVVLHATHSHSGPATKFGVRLGDPEQAYLELLREAMLAGAEEAMKDAETVTLESGFGECDLGWNRRMIVDGSATHSQNKTGPKDHELQVLRFRPEDGYPKALLLHYTCHPVLSSENALTSEYCGYAVDSLESRLGDCTVVGFLQGTCGDINPYMIGDWHGLAAVREAGRRVAEEAERTLALRMKPIETATLRARRYTAELPYEYVPSPEQLMTLLQEGAPLEREWAEFLLNHPERIHSSATFEATRLDIGEGRSLLFMNGEMSVGFGLFVKSESNGSVTPVAYSNGMIGYVTTALQLQEGGYEPRESVLYFGLPAPFGDQAETAVLQVLKKAIVAQREAGS
jgi:Neutral/alkaline non-lysosomal ceramidase, N-terminal